MAVHDMARDAGIPVWIGGMLESAVGASICVELATLENFTYPGDLFPSSRFYRQDLLAPALELAEGCVFKPFTGACRPPTRSCWRTVHRKRVTPGSA